MLLGKRPRPPIRRTTSVTEFSGDMVVVDNIHKDAVPTDVSKKYNTDTTIAAAAASSGGGDGVAGKTTHQFQQQQYPGDLDEWEGKLTTPMVSLTRNPRRYSVDSPVETAHFLRACGLCNRRLAPGKDIFMYRGEIAFCSSECRQQQMSQEEKKGNCSMTSIKNETAPATAASESSGSGGETAAAA